MKHINDRSITTKMHNNVFILLSGGLDSTCCLHYYLSKSFNISALHINYGQLSASKEQIAVSSISNFYNIPVKVIKIRNSNKLSGYIPARNSLLLNLALMNFPFNCGLISLGVHSGTNYADCSNNFIVKMQSIFDLYSNGSIMIDAPFINWTKSEIWAYSKEADIPVNYTYSCELGKKQPCGKCISCKELEVISALS